MYFAQFGYTKLTNLIYAQEIIQGSPTTKCFQVRQKCVRWFSLYLFGQFGVARKTIYLFGCLRGTLFLTKVLGGYSFVSSESVSHPYGSGRKFENMK